MVYGGKNQQRKKKCLEITSANGSGVREGEAKNQL